MYNIVVLCHGYWGSPDMNNGWEKVVTGTLLTAVDFIRNFNGQVELLIGTGELERNGDTPLSRKLARDAMCNSGSPDYCPVGVNVLDAAHSVLECANTGMEVVAALELCKTSGADTLVVVHRPEHVRAYVTALTKAREADPALRVMALAGPHDFDGVGPAVCVEGVHMRDPALDAFAQFDDHNLRKQLAAEPFFVAPELLPGYVDARLALRATYGLSVLKR